MPTHPCPPFGRGGRGTYRPRQPDGQCGSQGPNSIDAIAFVEGMMLRDYAFDKYLTSKEEDPEGPVAIDVQVEDAAVETVTEATKIALKAIVPESISHATSKRTSRITSTPRNTPVGPPSGLRMPTMSM